MALPWDSGLPAVLLGADLDVWAEGLPVVGWLDAAPLAVVAPAGWDSGLPVVLLDADFDVWSDGLPFVGGPGTITAAVTAAALIYMVAAEEGRAHMNPIIAGQTNPLGYLAEKRDGSGPVATGANVTLKIRNVTDGKWWNGATSQWQDSEVAVTPTHVSGGAWEYLWSTPAGDAGDIVQLLWQDETDQAVGSGQYGRVYSPDSLVAKLLSDILSDKQAFPGARIDRSLGVLAQAGEAAAALGAYGAAKTGDKMDLVNAPNATGVQALQSGLAKDATTQAIKGRTDRIPDSPAVAGEAGTALSTYGPAKPGDKMDLVNAPNATAVATLQSGLATAAALGALHDLSSAQVQAAAVAALQQLGVVLTSNLVGLALESTAQDIKAKTDRIPASPAAVGDLLTAQAVRDALMRAPSAGTPAAGSIDALWATLVGKLPVGALAASAEVTAIQNNTGVARIVPPVLERPDAGGMTYTVRLYLYDSVGNMETPDSAPTLHVENQVGTGRDDHLDSTTMVLESTGVYKAVYTLQATDALEQLNWKFAVSEGSVTRQWGNSSLVVDTTAVDFTAEDRAALAALGSSLAGLNDLDAVAVQAAALAALQGYGAARPGDAMGLLSATLSAIRTGLALSGDAANALSSYAPARAGDKMDLVNAPSPTAVLALQSGLAKEQTAQGIKGRTDRIPDSPAVAGEAQSAVEAYGAAKPGAAMELVEDTVTEIRQGLALSGEAQDALEAYAPAKAGDRMDLVNAPNAAAVEAMQNGLAAEATAQDIKGRTDLIPNTPAARGDAMGLTGDAVSQVKNGLALDNTAQAIKQKTDHLPSSPAASGEAGAALQAYDPPTNQEMLAALAGIAGLSQDQIKAAAAEALAEYGAAKPGEAMALTTATLNAVRDGLATSLVVLSWLQAMVRSDVPAPEEFGGDYQPALHSLEALRAAVDSVGTGMSPSVPPGVCRCYDDFRWVVGGGTVEEGAAQLTIVRVVLPEPSEVPSTFYASQGTVVKSDAEGRVTVDLVQGATVEILEECGDSSRNGTFTVPSQATAYIPDHLQP